MEKEEKNLKNATDDNNELRIHRMHEREFFANSVRCGWHINF